MHVKNALPSVIFQNRPLDVNFAQSNPTRIWYIAFSATAPVTTILPNIGVQETFIFKNMTNWQELVSPVYILVSLPRALDLCSVFIFTEMFLLY